MTILLNAVFNPPLEIVHRSGQQLLIDREHFLPGGIPRSPDLSCDFFLWGYLKGRVYTHKPRNLNELKDAIRQEVLTIDQQLLARAMDDFKRRFQNGIQEDGRHLTLFFILEYLTQMERLDL